MKIEKSEQYLIMPVADRIWKYIKQKWADSADGYVNQGSDARLMGRLGAFGQHLLSFRSKAVRKGPYNVIYQDSEIFVGSPPYVVVNVKLAPKRFFHVRIGWRYDENWAPTGGWIFDMAVKIVDHKLIWR